MINKIQLSYISGPRVDIGGDKDAEYLVNFIDMDTGLTVYRSTIKQNCWSAALLKYYINWRITVDEDGRRIVDHHFDVRGKKVYVQIASSALGDTLAWIPYVEEFQRERRCEVHAVTNWNHILEGAYPGLKWLPAGPGFANPSQYEAAYHIGTFDNDYTKNKNNWRFIPLQQVASDMLGLKFKEIKPRVVRSTKPRPISEKYVTIAEHSTFQGKFWNYPDGWQGLVDWLNAQGFKVMSVSREETNLNNVIKCNGKPIEETINNIQHSEFFIGVASGLAWLAWALDVKPVIISGFTEPYSEMTDCVRIINENVCHGCYNDQHVQFDRGNWRWCPRNNNFDCSTKITLDMVQRAISSRLLNDDRFRFSGLVVNTRDGAQRNQDMNVVNAVLVGDEYGLGKMQFAPKVILDIGGHIGSFGLKAKSLWPEARLIAYEPNAESAELYRRNMTDNGFTNWEVCNKAIAYDSARTCLAEDHAATGGGILIRPDEINVEGAITDERINSRARYSITNASVPIATMEEALVGIDHVDLLKLDCEGSEIEILRQMSVKTAAKVGHVVGEYHYARGYDGFVELFRERFPQHRIESINQPMPYIGEFRAIPDEAQRVLMVMHHCSTGGMPQYVLRCVEKLKEAGKWVEVIEFNYAGGFEVQRKQFQKLVPFHSLNGHKVESLKEVLARFRPDVVHVQEFPEHWAFTDEAKEAVAELYRPGHPYRIVETTHGMDVLNGQPKVYLPDAFVWVSKYHEQRFAYLGIPSTIVQYDAGAHTRPDRSEALARLGLDPTQKHVLNVGLFTPGKNQSRIFSVARNLANVQFHFVGNFAHNFKDYWESLMPAPSNCKLWGERDDVDSFYSACDLFLFTSKWELNPLVVKEALSWNMPVLMQNLETYCGEYDGNQLITFIDDSTDDIYTKVIEILYSQIDFRMLHSLEIAYR